MEALLQSQHIWREFRGTDLRMTIRRVRVLSVTPNVVYRFLLTNAQMSRTQILTGAVGFNVTSPGLRSQSDLALDLHRLYHSPGGVVEDCSRVCTVGTLNAACDACTCDNHVLDGRVTDTRNAPLDGAEIYLAEKPWEVASTTNSTGRFTLAEACSQGTLILVRRGGYFEEYANSTQRDSETSSVAVKMRVMEPPIMDENPVGKVRLVGQDVTFCCRAHGTPKPSSYEWFKDDRVLDEDVYRYNETLTLYDLQKEDSGVYKCRANSDAGAKYSTGALLTVYDNDTAMCNSTPAIRIIDLPDDCVQPDTNTTKYDIGTCPRQKCAGDLRGDDKSCLDSRMFCCSPVASETLDQVTLTFRDLYRKNLVTTTKVLPVEEGIESYYTVRMQVRPPASPLNASETSTINLGTLAGQPSLAEVDIPPNSFFTENGDLYTGTVQASVGFIDPRNPDDFDDIQSDLTTVDEEGTQQALRTFGMFSMEFEDDEGNPVVMGGKMTMHIDPEQVNINPNDVDENGNLNTKLWSLNPVSGEWEFVGYLKTGTASRRRKRAQTFFIGEFEYRGDRVYNIDRLEQRSRACYVKVRVYKNENAAKKAIESEQEQGAQVTVITIDTAPDSTPMRFEPSNSLSRYDVRTASSRGACVATFCEDSGTEFNASVQVYQRDNFYKVLTVDDHPYVSKWPTKLRNSMELHDDSRTIVFDVFKPSANNGPIYQFNDWSLCYSAPITDNHIAFYNTEYQPYRFPPYVFEEPQYNEPITELSWYNTEVELPGAGQKRVCFIKVRVLFSNQDSRVEIRTKSVGGGQYLPNSGKVYGIRDDQTQTDSTNSRYGFACVEFKCPGEIKRTPDNARPGAPSFPVDGSPSDNVILTVVAKNPRCYYNDIDSDLETDVQSSLSSEGNKVEFTVPPINRAYSPHVIMTSPSLVPCDAILGSLSTASFQASKIGNVKKVTKLEPQGQVRACQRGHPQCAVALHNNNTAATVWLDKVSVAHKLPVSCSTKDIQS
ncbi:hypothetical protein Bbelb_236730 [Branchiostoma belcheri]|nr:hypothetical protein Bbelb_236730 [Branchiostoma belcheri]